MAKTQIYEGQLIRRQYRVSTIEEVRKILSKFYSGTYYKQGNEFLVLIF